MSGEEKLNHNDNDSDRDAAEKAALLRALRSEMALLGAHLKEIPLSLPGREEEELWAQKLAQRLTAINNLKAQIDALDVRQGFLPPKPAASGRNASAVEEILSLLREIEEIHGENVRLAQKAKGDLVLAIDNHRRAGRVKAYLKKESAGGLFVDRRR